MTAHRLCLACGGSLHENQWGHWVHDGSNAAACPQTYAQPGPEFTPRLEWETRVGDVLTDFVFDHPRRFTTDPIHDRLDANGTAPPIEPRLLGNVLLLWARAGLIVPTGTHVPSTRPVRHRRPLREWAPAERRGAILVPSI